MGILLNIVHNCEMYQHNIDQAMNIAADEHELDECLCLYYIGLNAEVAGRPFKRVSEKNLQVHWLGRTCKFIGGEFPKW